MEEQWLLYMARSKAEAWKQIINWNTTLSLTPENVRAVYAEVHGEERASNIASAMSRALKEAEADRALNEAAERASSGN